MKCGVIAFVKTSWFVGEMPSLRGDYFKIAITL